ncbi:nitrate- and nitrite sensing domain-containing protein [Nocardia sp. NPDC088792]|uniref:sensor histidine kinase n=1 Tax=Nocardia sp. NPDC088792 TaxID=3364332 RepID=UPI0037F8CFCC
MKLRPAKLLPRGNGKLTPATEFLRPRTIRARLRRILIFSVTLVLVLLAIVMAGEVGNYRATGDTVRAVNLALAVQDLVHEVQKERGLTNGALGGNNAMRQSLGDQRAATDTALQSLNKALSDNPTGSDQVRTALSLLAGVSANRSDVDARRIDRNASFTFYTNAIHALNQTRPGLDHAQDSTLWKGLESLYALGDVKEFTGQERGFLNGVFAAGGFEPGEYAQFLDIRAGKQAAMAAFERDATPAQRSELYTVMRGDDATRAGTAEQIAIDSVLGPLTQPVATADWWKQMTSVIDAQRVVQRHLGDEIRGRAVELQHNAAMVLGIYALIALLAVAAQIALVVSTVRAIVRPLADLASEADAVAEKRLPQVIAAWADADAGDPAPPEPVRADADSGEEILSVAHALDRVQTTAYELASAQARLRRNTTESMANLARRNQNLVRRQLSLISDFEQEELDPNALSNLFELDHLATRMRRNAESLLVLVGESNPRRWSKPIPLTDVIRAGLSEVDDYRRVVLRRIDDVAIAGAHVSEVAHMLAELIENGLAFSPPDMEVEIYGRRLGRRYTLAVVDHGVGMPADQLAISNARLQGKADFLVAPTRFLGHWVVGRLAKRLGIDVELNISPTSGVVARLNFPPELLGDENTVLPELGGTANHLATSELPAIGSSPMPESSFGRHRSTAAPAADPQRSFGAADVDRAYIGSETDRSYSAADEAARRSFDTASGTTAFTTSSDLIGDAVFEPSDSGPITGSWIIDGPRVETPGDTGTTGAARPADTERAISREHNPIKFIPLGGEPGPALDTGRRTPDPERTARSGSESHAGSGARHEDDAYQWGAGLDGNTSRFPSYGSEPAVPARGDSGHDRNYAPNGQPPAPAAAGTYSDSAGTYSDDTTHAQAGREVSVGVPEVQRTRNGLVKRSRKTRENSGVAPGGAQRPAAEPRNVAPPAERTPEQVRSMLAGFRSGHQRGESGEPPRPGSNA